MRCVEYLWQVSYRLPDGLIHHRFCRDYESAVWHGKVTRERGREQMIGVGTVPIDDDPIKQHALKYGQSSLQIRGAGCLS